MIVITEGDPDVVESSEFSDTEDEPEQESDEDAMTFLSRKKSAIGRFSLQPPAMWKIQEIIPVSSLVAGRSAESVTEEGKIALERRREQKSCCTLGNSKRA